MENSQPQTANEGPVRKIRVGQISANIWRNDGQNGAYFTVTFERSVKSGDNGEWRNYKSFRSSDFFSLVAAGFQAYQALNELEAGGSQ